jgi:hypothetical protein
VDVVVLLGEGVDPAALVAARESREGAAAADVVEHRDVLGHAQWRRRGQHDAELPDPDALRVERHVGIE